MKGVWGREREREEKGKKRSVETESKVFGMEAQSDTNGK